MARFPNNDAVYKVADLFRERCLVDGRSLLWPDKTVWGDDGIRQFYETCFDPKTFLNDAPAGTNRDKWWDDIARDQPSPDIKIMAADIVVLYQIYGTSSAKAKFDDLNYIFDNDPSLQADQSTWTLLEEAFGQGIGSAGRWYKSSGQESACAFYTLLIRNIRRDDVDVFDASAITRIATLTHQETKSDTRTVGNVILHLLFPDERERIPVTSNKEKIFDHFATEAQIPPTTLLDDGILQIRRYLEQHGYAKDFDFWEPEIKKLWDPPKVKEPEKVQPVDIASTESAEHQTADRPGPNHLAGETFLSLEFLNEINDLLLDRKQLIFEGPPGSGKTFVADKFAEWFAGDPERVETVQFHQSYGYEDFVQGIRPETSKAGTLTYHVRDGIFKQLCDRAAADPGNKYVLIIDEINRGNISRIFGELLFLLEYRNKTVKLPYGANEDGISAGLTIPENLFIIGTMNSADRSLAQVDYALRRRFYFVRFMPVENGSAPILQQWLYANQNLTRAQRSQILELFITLNKDIEETLSADVQIGHSYFMQAWIGEPGGIDRVWKRAVKPLLEEYFHHHRDRQRILDRLTPALLSGNANAIEFVEVTELDEPPEGSDLP